METVNIEAIQERIEKMVKAYNDALSTLFRENIYRLMDEEKLQSVSWENYANYFNDGDPCPFRARTYMATCVHIDGTVFEDGICEKISEFLGAFPDSWYEEQFGNDSSVIVKNDGSLERSDFTDHD